MNIEELKQASLFDFGEENVSFAEHFDDTSYLGASTEWCEPVDPEDYARLA